MNAVLSLCHFCELHGPRIVFNTQTFREPPVLLNFSSGKESFGTEETKFRWKYGRIDKEEFKLQPSLLNDTCSACQSFPHCKAAIVTNEDETQVSFVSSQYPFQEEIFTLLRQAGIRSLSCEVYSEREGPIYFGDNARGHVISYSFFLKDIHARGFLRRYSILVMMADKMFLLNSWSFFIRHIQEIIKLLQDLSSKVYAAEEKNESQTKGLKPPVSADNSKRHRVAGNPRPLVELVGDKDIWTTLHMKFTWLLKAGSLRLQEKLVEGPPLFVPEVKQGGMTLQSFVQVISPKNFETLLHHIYIGNIVLFSCADTNLLTEIPMVLKALVPSYVPLPCRMTSGTGIVDKKTNVITTTSGSDDGLTTPSLVIEIVNTDISEKTVKDKFLLYNAIVTEKTFLPSRPPQIVAKICALVKNTKISDSVLNLHIAALIDEWTNKVKIWSYIIQERQAPCGNIQSYCQQSLSIPTSPSVGRKNPGRSSSPTHGSIATLNPTTSTLLTVVGGLECDIPLLNALSVAYENSSSI